MFIFYGQVRLNKIGPRCLALGISLVWLVGCQTVTHKPGHQNYPHKASSQHEIKDGAPLGPIPAFFRAIIPKPEPLSRYGNPRTYSVAGHRYSVLKSSKGFKQRGLASWYGTKFHSRRTSSGENYNMYALTAAHKTLPLPTYVRVKNLDNGKVIVVKVNDRGPFHPGRIIDLSYGAAVKLGVFPKGTARVEIEAIRRVGSPQQTKFAVSRYYIQVGAFKTKQSAEQMKRRIATDARAPASVLKQNKKYILRLGPFTDKQRVQHVQALLRKKGVRGSVSLVA